MSYRYGYHENSRFVHASSQNNRQNYSGKRPLAGPKQPQFWHPTAYQPEPYSNPLGINTNKYGYGESQHVLEPYMNEYDRNSSHDFSETPPTSVRDLNGVVNSVFNKISQRLLDGQTHDGGKSSSSGVTPTSHSINVTSFNSTINQITSAHKKLIANNNAPPEPKRPKVISDSNTFKVPAIPSSHKAAVHMTVTIDKSLEKPKVHVSAKDMWEISYKKEVNKSSKPTKAKVEEPQVGEVIDIVPITEDTSFIYEGVDHFYVEKVQDKISVTECKLCEHNFTTAITAKKHYKSQKHQSKLSKFIVDAVEPGTGFDLEGSNEPPVKTSDFDPVTCTLCNVSLNSQDSARNHFASKSHKQKVKDFLTAEEDIIDVPLKDPKTLPVNTPPCISWDEIAESENSNTVKICRLCGIKMSSLVSSKDHYMGKLHKKRIRMAQTNKLPTVKKFKKTNFVSGGTLSMETDRRLYEQYMKACEAQQKNSMGINFEHEKSWLTPNYGKFANCMTPSGQFYCTICNLTVPTREKLRAHEFSREHKLAKSRQKSIYQ